MTKYVALDIGNVLCRIDFKQMTSALSKQLNISTWEAGHRLNRSQKMRDVGLLTMADVLEQDFDIKSSVIIEELLNVWNNKVVKFDLEILEAFQDIRDLKIVLLSNVGADHAILINKFFFPLSKFGAAVQHFSCNVGVRKPQSLYYQCFLSDHPEFTGCVYLDDIKENLDAGRKFGFNSHEFNLETMTNIKQAMKDVENSINEAENKNSRRH